MYVARLFLAVQAAGTLALAQTEIYIANANGKFVLLFLSVQRSLAFQLVFVLSKPRSGRGRAGEGGRRRRVADESVLLLAAHPLGKKEEKRKESSCESLRP